VVTYASHLRGFYEWCEHEGLVTGNPVTGLPLPRLGRRLPRPIGEEDLMRAVALAPPRVRPWLILAAWCGLRSKEIAYLRRENILDTVRPPVLMVAYDATKGHTERVLPLGAYPCGELAAAGLPPAGFAFRRHDGQRGPNEPWLVSHLANEYLHDLGIAATLHMCRHRYGTQLYEATHDLRLVQELMGHKRPETTAGYADWSRAAAAFAVDALPIPAPARLRVAR
jgi:integrase